MVNFKENSFFKVQEGVQKFFLGGGGGGEGGGQ